MKITLGIEIVGRTTALGQNYTCNLSSMTEPFPGTGFISRSRIKNRFRDRSPLKLPMTQINAGVDDRNRDPPAGS